MSAILLWFAGAFFIGLGWVSVRICERVTHPDGSRDPLGERMAKIAGLVFPIIGALCWRFA